MPLLKTSILIICTEKTDFNEAQEKDFKIAILYMFKNLKGNMNKCINENTNRLMK